MKRLYITYDTESHSYSVICSKHLSHVDPVYVHLLQSNELNFAAGIVNSCDTCTVH